jgi:hypothetical protein
MEPRRSIPVGPVVAAVLALSPLDASARQSGYDKALAEIEQKTGLKKVEVPDAQGAYLGKTHRGYPVLYTAKAGSVWGRYAARLTMAEVGRETGGVLGYLTGHRAALGDNVVGSPLDRLLSKAIGQPLSVTILLKHGRPRAPRLDVLSGYAVVGPEEQLPKQSSVGAKAGSIFSADVDFARRLGANAALLKRLKNLRCEYIRVDDDAVTLLWAGSETDYSGMIMDHKGYHNMLNDMMDDLADIADAIPAPSESRARRRSEEEGL